MKMEDLRIALPGVEFGFGFLNPTPKHEKRDMILCEKRANGHNKTLTLVYVIRKFGKKFFFAHNFWVETCNGGGPVCQTFDTFDAAMKFYAKLA